MNAQHTPGPWTVDPGTCNHGIMAGDTMLAIVGANNENHEANARLMAVAPDLLAALNDVVGWYRCAGIESEMSSMGEQSEYHRTLNNARAAIAQAEGGANG